MEILFLFLMVEQDRVQRFIIFVILFLEGISFECTLSHKTIRFLRLLFFSTRHAVIVASMFRLKLWKSVLRLVCSLMDRTYDFYIFCAGSLAVTGLVS